MTCSLSSASSSVPLKPSGSETGAAEPLQAPAKAAWGATSGQGPGLGRELGPALVAGPDAGRSRTRPSLAHVITHCTHSLFAPDSDLGERASVPAPVHLCTRTDSDRSQPAA